MVAQSPPFALQNSSAHGAALFRQAVFSTWRQAGLVGPADLQVSAQSTPNMSVQVAAGRAWMLGTQASNVSGGDWSTQAGYFGINDAPLTVTISAANATNPRIDLIVAYVQDSFYSGSNNQLLIGVVTGTAAPSPSAPAAPSNALALAQVAVAANATSITNSNITNTAGLLSVARGGILPVTATDTTAGKYDGQYRDHPTYGVQRWNAAAAQWRCVGPVVLTSAQRQALTSTVQFTGLTVIESDTGQQVWWTGSRWQLAAPAMYSTLGSVNNSWAGTAYGWVSGLGAKITIPADAVHRPIAAQVTCDVANSGIWMRLRVDLGTGTTNYYPNATGFHWNEAASSEAGYGFGTSFVLDGSTTATVYLEAKADTAGAPNVIIPAINLLATNG